MSDREEGWGMERMGKGIERRGEGWRGGEEDRTTVGFLRKSNNLAVI